MNTKFDSTSGRRRWIKNIFPAWTLLICAVAWTGCKHEPKRAEALPVGEYVLVSVDGKKTPCSVEHQGRTMKVNSGVLQISKDGTCRSKITFATPNGAETIRDVKATCVRAGNKLEMKWQGAGETTGEISGDTFVMENEGMKFAYRK